MLSRRGTQAFPEWKKKWGKSLRKVVLIVFIFHISRPLSMLHVYNENTEPFKFGRLKKYQFEYFAQWLFFRQAY
jgi:hypothetical protein